MPKIAIDVSPLSNGNSQRGVGFYTKNLVDALQRQLSINPDFKDFEIVLVESKDQTNTKFDLVHYPFFDPFKLTLPFFKKTPTIITIHDVIERQFKQHYPVGIRGEIKWHIQKYLANRCDYIITVSHYSKFQIAKTLGYPTDQIYVTHEAAGDNFKKVTTKSILSQIKTKYDLPDKFILYVGDINWNKNIPGLVKACLKLKYPLVITGSSAVKKVPHHPWTTDIHWLQNIKSPLIKTIGFVPDEQLPALYSLATIYCQPSFAEGFGLTLVEAMKCGTPVVYSQETCLPEVVDYNGVMFDPYQPRSLEIALKQLWLSPALQKKYSQLGLVRSQQFSWDQTAIQTLSIYQLALLNGQH